MVGTELTPV